MKSHRPLAWIALIVAVVLGPSLVVAEEPATDEEQLRHLKNVLWPKSYADGDPELLDKILADEFQMVNADGVWTSKADELEWVSNNRMEVESFEYEIKRLEVFPNGTAIVAGTGTVRDADEKGPFTMVYQSTNVLIRTDEGWRAIASHVSGIDRTHD